MTKLARSYTGSHKFNRAYELSNKAYLETNASWMLGVRGDALLGLGKLKEARKDYAEYVRRDPGISSWSRLGHAMDIAGEDKASLKMLEKARDEYKGASPEPLVWIHLRVGIFHLQRENLKSAATAFQQSLEVDPQYFLAQEHLAEVYEIEGDYDKAYPLLKDAIKVKRAKGLLNRLANIERSRGKNLEATKLEKEALLLKGH